MKTNNTRLSKEEMRELKKRHRLEMLMQESGERFEAASMETNLWRSTVTPGLTVDADRQSFTISRPGSDTVNGDVFTWLKYRNGWTFPQAIRFLQKRPSDPKPIEAARPAKAETRETAREDNEAKPLDRWQERALEIAGERIRKYFSWSWYSLALYLDKTRIEPTHAPSETRCGRCEKRIDWNLEKVRVPVNEPGLHGAYRLAHVGAIPVMAYSIKHPLKPSDFGIESDEISEALSGLWVEEEDGVICQECAWREYDFQRALELAGTSAYWRDDAEFKERQERDRARWLEEDAERERLEREAEAAFECDFAAPLP